MPIKKKFFECISSPNYTPLSLKEFIQTLKISKKEEQSFKSFINKQLASGHIAKVKDGRYVLSEDADLVPGIIKFKASKNAILIPDDAFKSKLPDNVPIQAQDTYTALHGDRVLVKLFKIRPKKIHFKRKYLSKEPPVQLYGRVKKVLSRNKINLTGTLKKKNFLYYVLPDNPSFVHPIHVPDINKIKIKPKLKPENKVLVRLLDWDDPDLNPEGNILKNLGATHTPKVEYEALLYNYNLTSHFPKNVLDETKDVPKKVSKNALTGRLDCRKLFTITIDPDDAQDFDDALSYEKLLLGKSRIGVHIADVSAYVKSGTALDKEAQTRGNSTYLVGSVIPMLPKTLSNGICSLIEDKDRLTKSVFFTFDRKKNIESIEFANSVIRSNKRLTYHQAYRFLKEENLAAIVKMSPPPRYQTGSTGKPLTELKLSELKKIKSTIQVLWEHAAKLRRSRMENGSLDFDIPEFKIYVDAKGYAERIEKIENDESHQLIEEFMLAANQAVAKALFKAKMPFISRVHPKPDPDKLKELRETLLMYAIRVGDLTKRKVIVQFLKQIKNHSQGYTLKILFLRSLKQACYRAQAEGHYGLFMQYYTHFTSPIRRYSDLIVHRIFDNYLIKSGISTAPKDLHKNYTQANLETLSQHLSLTEQNSTEAERESKKIKLLEFFEKESQKKQKSTFKGIITEVRNYAIFIELVDSLAFGMVHLSTLKDDIYKLANNGISIVGRKHGKTYTAGQNVTVTIKQVDRFKRHIDFAIE